ncbi:hypothetical protein SAMN05444166_1376 [Singulisphaera sp. GP187]|nr:hypothetical protein SAMN05444166_1376 [Singulisphaera sp. GP187]
MSKGISGNGSIKTRMNNHGEPDPGAKGEHRLGLDTGAGDVPGEND